MIEFLLLCDIERVLWIAEVRARVHAASIEPQSEKLIIDVIVLPYGPAIKPAVVADPVPQALVLTAIVIGFGLLAFSLVLAHRVHATTGSDEAA